MLAARASGHGRKRRAPSSKATVGRGCRTRGGTTGENRGGQDFFSAWLVEFRSISIASLTSPFFLFATPSL